MSKGFFGKTYLYPTPNNNEQEIGVLRMSKDSSTYVVGYLAKNGLVERVLSASIPALQVPEDLQKRLDKKAAKLCLKSAGGEVVVRECMEASQVLPPETAAAKSGAVVLAGPGARVALDEHADPQAVRLILSDGWNRAQGGLVEIMRFGATLLAVREWVEGDGSQKRGPGAKGLKGWLADNCPQINYQTAYGYMCAAAGLRREAKLADDVPLLAMMGEDPVPEARAEKLRQRVQRILAKSTLGLLREAASAPHEAAPKGGQRDGAGRKSQEPQAERDACAAWAVIGEKIDLAVGWKFARFLPAKVAREALSTVMLLKDALDARIKELDIANTGA